MSNLHYDDECLINQYANSLFQNIEKEVNLSFKNNEDFSINSKKLNSKLLSINIRFKSSSTLNNLSQDIYFVLDINEKYPEAKPVLKCLSNFCFPTLFDGRDIFSSVFNRKWEYNVLMSEVIALIPDFINRIIYYQLNRQLIIYGNLVINADYNINSIIYNNELCFNKVFYGKVNLHYMIITEYNILLFHPIENKKSYGKLVLIVDIRDIKVYKGKSLFDKMEAIIGIELPFKDLSYIELNIHKNITCNNIIDILINRAKKLKELFDITHNDFAFKSINSLNYDYPVVENNNSYCKYHFFNILDIKHKSSCNKANNLELSKQHTVSNDINKLDKLKDKLDLNSNVKDRSMECIALDNSQKNTSKYKVDNIENIEENSSNKYKYNVNNSNKYLDNILLNKNDINTQEIQRSKKFLIKCLEIKLITLNKNSKESNISISKELIFIYQRLIEINNFLGIENQFDYVKEMKELLDNPKFNKDENI